MLAQQLLSQWTALAAMVPWRLLSLSGWLLAAALLFGLLEHWRPVRPGQFLRREFWNDVGYYFLGGVVTGFILTATALITAVSLHGLLPTGFRQAVAGMSLPSRVLAGIVVGDIGYYWAHRWMHGSRWLWCVHAVHHSPTQLDWLVNSRAHPLDLAFARSMSFVPIYLLGLAQPVAGGVPDAVTILTVFIGTFHAFLVHANFRLRLGWLEHLVVTPAFHHWHHANDGPQSLDKNFAAQFPWIDRMFGTHYLPRDALPQSYGMNDELPAGMWRQLFTPHRIKSRAS